ncbi:TPA: hypothetical protein N0F65_006497 [Lagenidium giganteum]|uniref:C2 Aida-type domain-containing protein n=1 Tax=Lagenidium giganteum TaxID=4803 RepID=A0AAV2YQE9_9STRA|nr:TPA: hypothetical protein N0F65_006497 [Lagenidium giganteum]
MESLEQTLMKWCRTLHHAVETDSWGQVIEAVEAYETLADTIRQSLRKLDVNKSQKATLEKTAKLLEQRAKSLSSVGSDRNAPTKEDMEDVVMVLRSLASNAPPVLPVSMAGDDVQQRKKSEVQMVEIDSEMEDIAAQVATDGKDTVERKPGASYLDIVVDRIGLKDASVYVNPTVVVSVHDKDGKMMGEKHETAVGKSVEALHVTFSSKVRLGVSLKEMEERGAAVFFEFVHYKLKKRKKSCRCWALLELDELKAGVVALELYQKPMDPKRKRINLFTVKDLYLHLRLQQITV